MGVDADGGHAHAGSHDGNLDALIGAGVALNAPDVVHQHRIFQEILGDELRTQGIAGHQYGFGKIAGFGGNVGSGSVEHRGFLLILIIVY